MPFLSGTYQAFVARKEAHQAHREKKKQMRKSKIVPVATSVRCYPLRYGPGVELIGSLHELIDDCNLKSIFIITCIGNIKSCIIKLSNTLEYKPINSTCDIVSLVGTFDSEGGHHIYGSFADARGNIISGQIESLIVHQTIEILLAECNDAIFVREHDTRTGENELVVKRKPFTEQD
ncbi:unnamed protein product [Didymodactylos carnosus]|uniref:PPC domain-containing protein n=1 Tax=Didymodactylos carnosus TaxID=1234261 RepID=A0A814YBI7_9BILA|nr:unnamed protein product [Didymodactylos carnosus]CAF1627529.1 unnamed protein product [Didymodactylos carnosus]CAF3990920.1 unnamed protein product [Didymodactylos carnosus]CAF4451325.1 unnamed protein product [Didymodactylos carnosus]